MMHAGPIITSLPMMHLPLIEASMPMPERSPSSMRLENVAPRADVDLFAALFKQPLAAKARNARWPILILANETGRCLPIRVYKTNPNTFLIFSTSFTCYQL